MALVSFQATASSIERAVSNQQPTKAACPPVYTSISFESLLLLSSLLFSSLHPAALHACCSSSGRHATQAHQTTLPTSICLCHLAAGSSCSRLHPCQCTSSLSRLHASFYPTHTHKPYCKRCTTSLLVVLHTIPQLRLAFIKHIYDRIYACWF